MVDRTVTVKLDLDIAGIVARSRVATKALADIGTRGLDWVGRNEQSINQLSATAGRFGLVAVAAAGLAVKRFADFDQAMSAVAATGDDARGSLDRLRQAAIDAGAETAFSATESASAIEQLAKAGVSAEDILAGGLTGALDLAAAGGIEVSEAAEIAATAMTQFGLSGDDVVHVADLLAAGAGKAQGGVTEMGEALKQSGLVAKQTGLTIEETTGALAAFASQGLLGSDAGTSFKTMLQRLAHPIGKAEDLMAELNISAFDAQGEFVGLAAFAGQLQGALEDMTPAQRNAALATIFGTDAVRAAAVLYEQGADGAQKWIDAVNDQGFAAETAATRLDNLMGDLEEFGGSLETAFIGAGTGADAPLRGLVQGATDAVNAFNELPNSVKSSTLAVVGLGGVALLGVAGLGKLVVGAANTRNSLRDLGVNGERARRGMRGFGRAVGFAAGALGGLMILDEINNLFGESPDDIRRWGEEIEAAAGEDKHAKLRALRGEAEELTDALSGQPNLDLGVTNIWWGEIMPGSTEIQDKAERLDHLRERITELQHQLKIEFAESGREGFWSRAFRGIREAGDAARSGVAPAEALGDAMAGVGVDAGQASMSIRDYASTVRGFVDAQRDVADAERGVGQAHQAVSDARSAAARSASDSAEQIRDAQRGVADAERAAAEAAKSSARQVADAQEQVRDAREQAAEAAEQAAKRVRDAQERLSDAREDAARAAEQAADRVSDAQERLTDVQVEARQAQRDLSQARKDAAQDLRDLRRETEDLALSEEGAEISLARARERLGEVQRDPEATGLDRREARLRVAEAERRLEDVRRESAETQRDLNQAEKDGVNGSQRVRDAKDAIRQANEDVRDATDAVRDAVVEQRRTHEESAEKIRDAQAAIRDAVKEQRKTQEESSERIRDAIRAVDDARSAAAKTAEDSARRISDAQAAVGEAEQDAARSAEDASRRIRDAQLGVEDAVRRVDDANWALIEAEDALVEAVGKGEVSFAEFEAQLVKWQKQGRITKERADELREAAERVDKEYNPEFKVKGHGQAMRYINAVKAMIDRFKSRGITLTINAQTGDMNIKGIPGFSGHLASGGPVTGPGGPTDDRAGLWALSDGEYVMRAASVAKYGRHMMDMLNTGRLDAFGGAGLGTTTITARARGFSADDFATEFHAGLARKFENAGLAAQFPLIGSGKVLPTGSYRIGMTFHGYPGHEGADYPAPRGTPVHAMAAGIVSQALRLGDSYGIHAFVDHPGGIQTRYAHMLNMFVGEGDRVRKGQRIGSVDSTGNSTGDHLHFEYRRNGRAINPAGLGIFDRGGLLMPGMLGLNMSSRPERVLSPAETAAGGRSVTVNVHFNAPVGSQRELQNWLSTSMDNLRRAGRL